MKKHIRKDQKIRACFKRQELDSIILKSIIQNENLSLTTKWNATLKLSSLSKNKNRYVNRCILTTRKAKFHRFFNKFSRLTLLKQIRLGNVSGLKKSSW